MNKITTKLRGLHKNWVFWLIFITGLAIVIRSIPGWIYTAWGADFGIYFGVTKSMLQTGELFPAYTGWGTSYNEFPIMYLPTTITHWFTGIDVMTLLLRVTPIFGGLSVFVFYFFAYEITKSRKIALLSALFLAVLPFHVYQTSHAAPLTMGHFFMILSMYLFIKYRQKNRYAIPLVISTILLVMSHHLTTYFYLIIVIFIVFIENATVKEWTNTFKKDIFYIIFTSILMFSYWASIAKTVFESYMISGFHILGIRLESIHIVLLFFALLFVLFGSIKLIRKCHPFFENIKTSIRRYISSVKKDRKLNTSLLKFFLFLILFYSLLIPFIFFDAPWVNQKISPEVIILSTPMIIAFALGLTGIIYTYHKKDGKIIFGWFVAVLMSLLYVVITKNETIVAQRHFEYLMVPLAVLMVFGLGCIFSDPDYKELLSGLWKSKEMYINKLSKKITISRKNRLINLLVILVIVVSLASTCYSAFSALNAANEEITKEDMLAIKWIDEHLDKNTSMIASDHRLARMAEAGFGESVGGFNTTKDKTVNLWDAVNLDEYVDELIGVGETYSRITHVIIDDIMKNQFVHVCEGLNKYMKNESRPGDVYAAYNKFNNTEEPIFNLVYRVESATKNPETGEPVHWAEVYAVNWTYIEKII